jgi:hypothetical protein
LQGADGIKTHVLNKLTTLKGDIDQSNDDGAGNDEFSSIDKPTGLQPEDATLWGYLFLRFVSSQGVITALRARRSVDSGKLEHEGLSAFLGYSR